MSLRSVVRSLPVLAALWALQSPLAAAPDAGQAPDASSEQRACVRLMEDASRALRERRGDEAARHAEESLRRCPPGPTPHLILGQAALMRGDLAGASRFFEKALGSSNEASAYLMSVFPRLPSERQQELSKVGSTPETPIQVRSIAGVDEWLRTVACPGGRLDKLDSQREQVLGATGFSFDCPLGTPRRVYFRIEQRMTSNEPLARVSDVLAVQRILRPLRARFGVDSLEKLRAAVADPLSADRSTAWLLGHLQDAPSQLRVYREMLRQDPDDLEAVVKLHLAQYALGDVQAALKTLQAAKADTVAVQDTRSSISSTHALFSYRCRALRLLGRNREALAECRTAIERGSKGGGPSGLGTLLFLQGKDAEALEAFDQSLARARTWGFAHYMRGATLRHLGREDEALAAWAEAPTYGPAVHAGLAKRRSRAEWIRVSDAYERDQFTRDLSLCGHYYLDLEMPKRAAACFAAAEKLGPALALAERIDHQSESDPEAAVRAGQKALRKMRHPSLLGAVAAAHQRAGRPEEALALLDEALKADPGEERAAEVLARVCNALGDPECLQTRRRRSPAAP